MLTDSELDHDQTKLQQFCQESERLATAQAEIVQKYTALIENYKRLQSDYEEARDSREKYKQLAKGKDQCIGPRRPLDP